MALALTTLLIAANAGTAAYFTYSLYHAVKSGGGHSPLEARVRARLSRKKIDRELTRLLRDTDKR